MKVSSFGFLVIQASYRAASAENDAASIADSGRPNVGVSGEADGMGTTDVGWLIHGLSIESMIGAISYFVVLRWKCESAYFSAGEIIQSERL